MTKPTSKCHEQLAVECARAAGALPALDVSKLAASLNDAAEQLGDAADMATMLADALCLLLREVPDDASPAVRLAAEACMRVGQRASVDFMKAHEKFVLEAERYGQ